MLEEKAPPYSSSAAAQHVQEKKGYLAGELTIRRVMV